MKKAVFFLLLLFSSFQIFACDVCGSNSSLNIYPSDNLTLIGFNYRYNYFTGLHKMYENDAAKLYEESYQRMDLSLKYSYKNRLEVIATLPYVSFHQKEEKVQIENLQGISDANVMLRYAFINTTGKNNHRLSVGASVDFPTGKSNIKSADGLIRYNFQPGSGAFNYLLNLNYGFKRKNYGIQNSVSYKINGTNGQMYNRGNTLNAMSEIFYQKKVKKVRLIAKTSFAYEHSGRNKVYNQDYTANTQRDFGVLGAGFDVYFQNIYLSTGIQKPVLQTLADNQLANKHRFSLGINYIIR
jgi:hypothetical protein